MGSGIRINRITSAAYAYPTDKPESDGTFAWDRTTIVIVEINAGDVTGLGYTYASARRRPMSSGRARATAPG